MNAIVKTETTLMNTSEAVKTAEIFAASGLFKDATDAAVCATKLIVGQGMGLNPYESMTGLNLIQGKVSLAANLMAAAIKSSGKYNYDSDGDDQQCTITISEKIDGKWINRKPRTFSMDNAKAAGLISRNASVWKAYPEAMLFARAISAAYREHCPDALGGGPVYVEEHGVSEIPDSPAPSRPALPAPVVEAVIEKPKPKPKKKAAKKVAPKVDAPVVADGDTFLPAAEMQWGIGYITEVRELKAGNGWTLSLIAINHGSDSEPNVREWKTFGHQDEVGIAQEAYHHGVKVEVRGIDQGEKGWLIGDNQRNSDAEGIRIAPGETPDGPADAEPVTVAADDEIPF
jgi:hypothetical protein